MTFTQPDILDKLSMPAYTDTKGSTLKGCGLFYNTLDATGDLLTTPMAKVSLIKALNHPTRK